MVQQVLNSFQQAVGRLHTHPEHSRHGDQQQSEQVVHYDTVSLLDIV